MNRLLRQLSPSHKDVLLVLPSLRRTLGLKQSHEFEFFTLLMYKVFLRTDYFVSYHFLTKTYYWYFRHCEGQRTEAISRIEPSLRAQRNKCIAFMYTTKNQH